MSRSPYPSIVTLPPGAQPYPTIADFLAATFPVVSREAWRQRISEGKVLDDREQAITLQTPYRPGLRLTYFREVAAEPRIPFEAPVLFRDDHLLVADKPHFLPVTPGGRFVNECLLHRLRAETGIAELMPLHRIDRETAGLVLFSVNPGSRSAYHRLFREDRVEKQYRALARCPEPPEVREWRVENRLEKGRPAIQMRVADGDTNARSAIRLLEIRDGIGCFSLLPLTGKTHQLRVHMSGLGFPILNDRHYPVLLPRVPDDFENPLQLLACALRFSDPLSGDIHYFESARCLKV